MPELIELSDDEIDNNSVVISLKAKCYLAQRPNCLMANWPLGQMTHVVIGLWPFGQLFQLALRLISLS